MIPEIGSIAKWLILGGLMLIGIGGILWLLDRSGLPIGSLPGDFRFEFGNTSCLVPIVSSILLSIILTIILNLVLRILK